MPYADFEDDDDNAVIDMSELEEFDEEDDDDDDNDEDGDIDVNMMNAFSKSQNSPLMAETAGMPRPLKPEELESLDDETILKNVFQALSGGKGHVSLKDLLNWDFVLDLVGEGLLDEEELTTIMKDCGGHRKGVDLPAFDKLVDSLVEKYSELEEDDEDTEGKLPTGSESDIDAADAMFAGSLAEGDEDSELRDNEDVLDIDVGEAFDKLSKGKNFVTLRAFMKWDVVSTLIREGYLEESEIEEMLETIKVEDSDRMDIVTFENLVTELASRFTEEDEDDEDDNADEFADIDESGNVILMNESAEDNDEEDKVEGDVFSDDDDTYDTNTEQLLKDLKSFIDQEEKATKEGNAK